MIDRHELVQLAVLRLSDAQSVINDTLLTWHQSLAARVHVVASYTPTNSRCNMPVGDLGIE